MNTEAESPMEVPRRSFVARIAAAGAAVVALAAPLVAGVTVLLDPLRKEDKGDEGNWIRVARLSQVPPDGKPHLFPVIEQEPRDKWNLYGPQPLNPIILIRDAEDATPVAFSSVCPHLGCIVGYDEKQDIIVCPCHNAKFETDGNQCCGSTVSPRDLDPLVVAVDAESSEVKVNYVRFKGGIAERVEV